MDEKKKHAVWSLCILLPALILITAYLLIALYYRNGFSMGTYINGVYCTGKTVEEVNGLLTAQYEEQQITVMVDGERTEVLSLDPAQVQADYTSGLQRILDRQNPLFWVKNLFSFGHYHISPELTYDRDALYDTIHEMECMTESQPEPRVEIVREENGYALVDTTKKRFSPGAAALYIFDAVLKGETTVDLTQAGCYEDLELTEEWKLVYREWELVQAFQDFHMKFLFGDCAEAVDESVMAGFISMDESGSAFLFDENGALVLNEDAVACYIDSLAEKYDTYGVSRQYRTVTGDTVTVESGIYGNELDREAETEYLIQAILDRNESDRTPEYLHQALYQGNDDIGPDFIEVNLTDQKLYFVKDYEIYLETDIVSGNLSWRLGTPSRICYVQGKYRNKVLRGPGYASFVNYWVPVYKNIGIHDATWRNTFGGEIYKTNGSHGCINVPLDQMTVIYEQLEQGMPVIMYYEDE